MSNFKGSYLRVLTPLTSDGVSPVVQNDRIQYREDHLPLSAKKMLEKKNEKLPSGLRKKIEVVSQDVRPAAIKASKPVAQSKEEIEEEDLTEESGDTEEQPPAPPKSKGGRPKKSQS